jgi:hypothetical protein
MDMSHVHMYLWQQGTQKSTFWITLHPYIW